MFLVTNENMGLCLYMNDKTSFESVRQIRRTEYPEDNLGSTRKAKLNIIFGCTCEASYWDLRLSLCYREN